MASARFTARASPSTSLRPIPFFCQPFSTPIVRISASSAASWPSTNPITVLGRASREQQRRWRLDVRADRRCSFHSTRGRTGPCGSQQCRLRALAQPKQAHVLCVEVPGACACVVMELSLAVIVSLRLRIWRSQIKRTDARPVEHDLGSSRVKRMTFEVCGEYISIPDRPPSLATTRPAPLPSP